MKFSAILLSCIVPLLMLGSCSKDEQDAYELRFVHIMDNEASIVNVSAKANAVGSYNIYLSAPQVLEPITVSYKLTIGDGLTEGLDYELVNAGTEVTFLPGIYDMPVRIKWLANTVDPASDNTIKIELLRVSNANYTVGLPGPDMLQRSLTITKIP